MSRNTIPATPAIRVLKSRNIEFVPCVYNYQESGGTGVAARELCVDEHSVIKTLVMEDENNVPLIILMHGDMKVSTKNLARSIGCRSINPCDKKTATKHTGYMVGGTSPLGTKRDLSVYMEKSITTLSRIYINGGRRGLLVAMSPSDLIRLLNPKLVTVSIV